MMIRVGFHTLLPNLLLLSLIAHKVQTSGDVGATFHLEPNHNPRAGEPARTWFALTRTGGQLIPLEQCECKLAVYKQPSTADDSPILEPTLKAISAEQYQGIPGADIIFPQAGAYELELSGTPKSGANFQAFNLKYNVNVSAGKTPTVASPTTQKSDSEIQSNQEQISSNQRVQSNKQPLAQWIIPVIVLAVILGIGGFWFAGVQKN